jgi:hypothetical protein
MALASIKPGVLVLFSVHVHDSGITRDTDDLSADNASTFVPEGATVRVTKTTTVHRDPAEHDRAIKLRGKIEGMIRRHLTINPFLKHCSFDGFDLLLSDLATCQALADEHNASPETRYTRVVIYFVPAVIGAADAEDQAKALEVQTRAARQMAEECKRILDDMSRGIDNLDPTAIREARERAQSFSPVLSAEQSTALDSAIETATKAANLIGKLQRKGEEAADILASVSREAIGRARIAFLDLSPVDVAPVSGVLPPVNVQRVASLDLDGPESTASESTATLGATPSPVVTVESASSANVDAASPAPETSGDNAVPTPRASDVAAFDGFI